MAFLKGQIYSFHTVNHHIYFLSNFRKINFANILKLSFNKIMKFLKSYWFYIMAAAITIFGLITGWYFFILIAIPFGLFGRGNRDR